MLPVVYGSFLRKNSITKFKYEKMKPSLLNLGNCLVAFAVTATLVSCGFLAFEKIVNEPVQEYDSTLFKECQELNNELIRQTALIREARPEGIDVNKIITTFIASKPEAISFVSLNISPTRYTIRCQAKDLNAAEAYTNSLDFGANKTVVLGGIQQVKGNFEFNIDVTSKAAPKKGS